MSKKVCRSCKLFVEGPSCPICKKNQFTDNWKGRITIIDVERSDIAKKMNITVKGEYAIKVK